MTGQGKTPLRVLAAFGALHAKRQARAMVDSREQEWIDRELGDVPVRAQAIRVSDWNAHNDIVNPDGSVRGIDRSSAPYWQNHAEPVRLDGVWTRNGFIATAACGARPEYATPSAQVENSTHPYPGSGVAGATPSLDEAGALEHG